jgi:hypothetical protein
MAHADEARAVGEGERHQDADEDRKAAADRPDREVDADRDRPARLPAAEPVDAQAALDVDEQRQRHGHVRCGDRDRDEVRGEPRDDPMQHRKQRCGEQWHTEGERRERAQSFIRTTSSGSVVP